MAGDSAPALPEPPVGPPLDIPPVPATKGAVLTCPKCHHTGDPFGPAPFYIDGDKLEYVTCRSCGVNLLVGRDVTL